MASASLRAATALLLAGLWTACSAPPPPPPPDCTHACEGRVCGREPVCGTTCGVCDGDATCAPDGRSCIAPPQVGTRCAANAECGSGRLCLGPVDGAPGGYCTKRCTTDASCPDGALCRLAATGETLCQAACSPGAAVPACRTSEGYSCADGGYCGACVPACGRRACGDDGCGGSCGMCDEPSTACDQGACRSVYSRLGEMPKPADLPAGARWDATAVTTSDSRVWVVGGRRVWHDADNSVYSGGVATVQRFNVETRAFEAMAPLPKRSDTDPDGVASPHAAALDQAVFVAGGTLDPDVKGAADSPAGGFWKFDNGSWRPRATMPHPTMLGALVALGGQLYLLGGGESSSQPTARVDRYDPASDRWTELQARPSARMSFAAAADANRMVVAGGWDGSKALTTVEFYDPAAGWSAGADLPVAVAGARAVVAGGRVILFGGWNGAAFGQGDPRPFVQTIDLATRRTALVGTTFASLLGQAPASVRDTLVLFGGVTLEYNALVDHADVVRMTVPRP